jgi:arylsulfatase A-like enzyme
MRKPRSLVLITVDCLRADHVSFLGYERKTTPFLDSLAGESLVVSNAIVAGSPTYYSFPSIMASRYPLALGRDVIGIAPGEATLASTLHQAGYATAAFVAGNFYLSSRFGYDSGFEMFRDFLGKPENHKVIQPRQKPAPRSRLNQRLVRLGERSEALGWIYRELYFRYCMWVAVSRELSLDEVRRAPPAHILVNHACEWLAGLAGKPFFLWLHLMDTHAPYYPCAEAFRLLGETPIGATGAASLNYAWQREGLKPGRYAGHKRGIVSLYDASIRWIDAHVARLVDRLRQLHLWENCVFTLTADHGEEFLEHGGRFHSPAKVTEELIRVPLLLRVPSGVAGVHRAPFSFLDLAPTLLDATASVPTPSSFRGRSHWKELQEGQDCGAPTVTENVTRLTNRVRRQNRLGPRVITAREARYKLVFDFNTRSEALFDLQADPNELKPLPVGSQREVRKRLLERVATHVSDSLQSRDPVLRLNAVLRDVRLEAGSSDVDPIADSNTFLDTVLAGTGSREQQD